ncbi:DUF4012 domain-containing protein [Candidatus Collierbacteria bacterium]|nr:DUF4012 domain-containing protein [Candidatus Collierbacteria bacterium]
MSTKILIFIIGLLIPSAKPCLKGFSSDGGPQGLLRGETGIQCLSSLPSLEPKLKFANYFLHSPLISEFLTLNSEFKPFLPHLDYFLGQNEPTSYLVLLQNNYELRANGGFFGSYAKLKIENGKLKIDFQDIYVPDGALVGHVEPPAPIQTAFKQGWFKLRDADWEPDFPTAATTIRWFLTKGNEINPDFLITLNLSTIEKIIAVLGDVYIPEYDLTLNHDNLYALLQNQSEIAAFDGSTQKKDVITAAGHAVIKKLSHLEFDKLVQLAKIVLDQLNHGNLLVNSTNESVKKIILSKDWGGQLTTANCQLPNCLTDTILLVETNLGANKANCCIERKTIHTISHSPFVISHLINLTLTNKSPLENPDPPRFYGGNYISYLRFYIPENATNIRLTAQPTLPKTLTQYPLPFDGINQKSFDLKDNYGLREVGFFHLTAAGTKSAVQLSYDLPLDNLGGYPISYQLNLLKQHGLESSPQEINLFGQSSSTTLETNFSENIPL